MIQLLIQIKRIYMTKIPLNKKKIIINPFANWYEHKKPYIQKILFIKMVPDSIKFIIIKLKNFIILFN